MVIQGVGKPVDYGELLAPPLLQPRPRSHPGRSSLPVPSWILVWSRRSAWLSPPPCGLSPLLALSLLLWAGAAPAGDTLSRCSAWQRSHGVERILLGNAIGAAHYLTKREKLLESPPDAPITLYSESDLQRVCSSR